MLFIEDCGYIELTGKTKVVRKNGRAKVFVGWRPIELSIKKSSLLRFSTFSCKTSPHEAYTPLHRIRATGGRDELEFALSSLIEQCSQINDEIVKGVISMQSKAYSGMHWLSSAGVYLKVVIVLFGVSVFVALVDQYL